MTTSNNEEDIPCPPGMKPGKEPGDCISADDKKSNSTDDKKSEQDSNAGTTTDAGTTTPDEANPTPISGDDHECPQGSTWKDGKCAPTSDSAGMIGGAGTGSPDVPGKEALLELVSKSIERTMAGHTAYNQKLLESFKEYSQKQLATFAGTMGLPKVTNECAAFGNVKTEASSMVDNSGYQSVHKESVENPAKFFVDSANNLGNEQFMSWRINPTAYLESLKHGTLNYSWPDQPHQNVNNMKSEDFTIVPGDMPQVFSKQVYLIPGGRMKVPIRQFLDVQIIQNADRHNWYKVNGFDFDDTTAEGNEPTNESQTITKIQAIPTIVRAVQTVNYADIENAPFDLIETFNRAAALGAIDAESKEILTTTYEGLTGTPNTVNKFQWIRGDTGEDITADSITGLAGLKQEGILAAKRAIDNKGGDSSPGNLVAFLNPESVESLINDTANDAFTGSPPVGAPLHSTSLGILENRLGLDIVMNNRLAKVDNASDPDVSRDIVMMKGSIGLVVAADLQMEAQRRPELSAIKIAARHRIKGAILDETMTVRLSNAIADIV
jgi:hypothetical protein